MPFDLVQLSDLHLLAEDAGRVLDCPVRASLREVVEAARRRAPEAVLLTGDLSQDGSAASYQAARRLVRPLEAPCYAIPGNHDDASHLRAALSEPPLRPDRSFAAGGWRLLLLDSAVPGEVHGRLAPASLRWLAAELEAHPDAPTLLALHHPPKPPGAAWLDPLGLHDPEPLLDLVAAHAQVQLVLFGHIHQAMEARHAQAHLYSCPSTCFQFKPHAETFALDRVPAGYRHVRLFPDGSFTTALHRVRCTYALDVEAEGY